MQDPTIVLNCALYDDEGVLGPLTDQTYERFAEEVNRTTYVHDTNHTTSMREQIQLYRTFARRSGASRGSRKCSAKITQDVTVPNADGSGSIVLPLISEINFSIPEGTAQTVLDNHVYKLKKLVASTAIADLVARLSI